MILHFGIDFDGPVYKLPAPGAGELYAGPRKLLHWMEAQCGLSGYPEQTDYLRIELYRQSVGACIDGAFCQASYEADRFATATELLQRRDALLLAAWDFQATPEMPERLAFFAAVEPIFRKKIQDPAFIGQVEGFAERMDQAIRFLPDLALPLEKILLYEPEVWLPVYMQRLLSICREKGIPVETAPLPEPPAGDHHLAQIQRRLLQRASPTRKADPDDRSLLILKARRDSDAAAFLAKLMRRNENWRPLLLIPDMNLTLDQALWLEGFPAMGILSSSSARPSLQVLKLATAFLWEPLDVYKIMEFVTLPVKPLDDQLALVAAKVIAEKPGINSDAWFAAVFGYLEQAETPESARKQYEFWFDRRRYPVDAGAPKRDAMTIYAHLQEWARDHFEQSGRKHPSLLALAEQARRIRELLDALPEQRIGFLELERIVRTIYDPSPVQWAEAESGALPYVHRGGAIAVPCQSLLWWNCLYESMAPEPDRWTPIERSILEQQNVRLQTPDTQSKLNLLRLHRPIHMAREQIVLVFPDNVAGTESVPGLLLGDIEAAFEKTDAFTFNIDLPADRSRLEQWFQPCGRAAVSTRLVGRPQAFLTLKRADLLKSADYETPTQLDSLFYYPHRWFLRQKARLNPVGLLSVTADHTLLGNLAHRFFEYLLKEDLAALERADVYAWVDRRAESLLEKEGATLLMYGREPERNAFLNRVRIAAWSLIAQIKANNWQVLHTEHALEGHFAGVPIRGKADLVLQRGDEYAIVDLKWSGTQRRKEMIQNGEDIQLVLYGHMLPPAGRWPHTAYFILRENKIIARNQAAFRDALMAGNGTESHEDTCERIFRRMERTFQWRMEQIAKGRIEIRTARTAGELEAIYGEILLDMLEMKQEDAKYDDYRTLLDFA